jgi:hypothetical protein
MGELPMAAASVLAGFQAWWPILKGELPRFRQSSGCQFHSFQSSVAHFGHAVVIY